MDAIILAGGFGTRLQSVVKDVPKPMAPMGEAAGNRPFLSLQLEYLKKQGITRAILATHHMHDAIESFLGLGHAGIPIVYAFEESPLYSGGAIVNAMHKANLTKPFLVVNGDTFVEADYRNLYTTHLRSGAPVTMLLRHIPDTSRSGVVELTGTTITRFGERGASGQPGFINAGVWAMNPEILAAYPLGHAFSFEKDFLQPNIPHALQPQGMVTDGYFIDIGVPEDYARAQTELVTHI